MHEFDGTHYQFVASVSVPHRHGDRPMVVDDMESGDVNHDGRADAVFCGNTGQVHVLTYSEGEYLVEFTSPSPAEGALSQACSVGDITNDGALDILVVTEEGARVYRHDGITYQEVWVGPQLFTFPSIATSAAGDSDNDGKVEFLYHNLAYVDGGSISLYESDVADARSFQNTASFAPLSNGPTVIIGNLNPDNDEPEIDCDDNDPNIGLCGDRRHRSSRRRR